MTEAIIFIFIYLFIAIIFSKLLIFYEKYDRKNRGIYNWEDVNPTINILIGLIWPFSIPIYIIFGVALVMVTIIRVLFF